MLYITSHAINRFMNVLGPRALSLNTYNSLMFILAIAVILGGGDSTG